MVHDRGPPPPPRPVCFDELVHDEPRAAPISSGYYQSLARASHVCTPPPADGALRVLLVQRVVNRRILNVSTLLAALRRLRPPRMPKGFQSLRVAHTSWERLSVAQQMATACATHVMIAAHGAGNHWSHFLNAARPDSAPGGALLELALHDWGNCQYAREFARRGYVTECQSHPRAHPERREFWGGVKPDDLVVRVDNITRAVDRLVGRLADRFG